MARAGNSRSKWKDLEASEYLSRIRELRSQGRVDTVPFRSPDGFTIGAVRSFEGVDIGASLYRVDPKSRKMKCWFYWMEGGAD